MRIAIEGIDGAGKSTLITALEEAIKKEGELGYQIITKSTERPLRDIYRHLLTTEPYISPELSFFLGLADYKYAEERVEKADFVLLDRSFISSLADCLSLGIECSNYLTKIAEMFSPIDILIFMDINAEIAASRKQSISEAEAGGGISWGKDLVKEFISFQSKNYENFKMLIDLFSKPEHRFIRELVVISNEMNPESAAEKIMSIIKKKRS